MKKSVASALYLLAPCLALGGFALFLSARSSSGGGFDVFGVRVTGATAQTVSPADVYEGYDRHFRLEMETSGIRPLWWGRTAGANGRSTGTQPDSSQWNFWLERGGKRVEFAPSKKDIWTSEWDAEKKCYYNEFSLYCGPVPDDATLKMGGKSVVGFSNGTKLSRPVPFEVTLKKAGEQWKPPVISTNPGFVVRKIELSHPRSGDTEAEITVQLLPGTQFEGLHQYSIRLYTPPWKSCSMNILRRYSVGAMFTPTGSADSKKMHLGWTTRDIQRAPQRDLILSQTYSVMDKWPLEIAFPVKKNGQPLLGVVPVLTPPRGK